ncbi:MAG: cytochrome c3 family protein [Nitrospirae bacterium]|nr:cytochrome c3 family protein [Nitrospirota bacterium]MCL5237585.1 cytochrome c3 family protein [Nitrospirota bacterium]
MKGRKKIIFVLAAFLWMCVVLPAQAGDVDISDEAQKCLGCHAKHGLMKTFENGDSIKAYVDAEKFRASAHNSLRCSGCHTDFAGDKHPKRRFRSKEQYKIKASLACRTCHTCDQIRARSIHAKLLNEEESGKAHPCTNCHGSHAVMPVGRKAYKNEKQYCLKCHGYKLGMEFKNGEKLSLKMDLALLQSSVHKKLSCSDCHFGFSNSQHPQRNFKSLRNFSIANSEICRRCHFDKYTKTMESIHYTMFSQGNLNAPACTDCHGSHSVLHFGKERKLIAQRCRKCHAGVYEIYANSVHGKALFDEHNQDVPVCIDCHTAHDIKNPLTLDYRERIPDMCSKCHANKSVVSKYGLSTDVVETYLSDFHGVTLSFYRKQREEFNKPARLIAVCTDCHGTHNIISTRSTDPAIVKANLVKRCRQCHKDAAKNFPDAWLSHYEPTLANAPLVFIVTLIYKIFTPIMAIGIILQIILHIWRYAVNR